MLLESMQKGQEMVVRTSEPKLLTMNQFANCLGVSRVTARKIASGYPEYLVPHGENQAHRYVNSMLVDRLLSVNEDDSTHKQIEG